MLVGSSKQLIDGNFSTFIVLSIVWAVPSFAVIFTVSFLFPADILDILIVPSNPGLFPLEYPGYTLFTSVLDVPYWTVPKSFPSIYTLTSFIPELANAHPLIFNFPAFTVKLLVGSSKQLIDGNFSIFIPLSIVCVVPSFAVIFTVNFLFPADILDTFIVPSNPGLFPLEYPGYTLFTSALDVPYGTVPKSFPSTYTLTSFTPELANAHPLILSLSDVTFSFVTGSSNVDLNGNSFSLSALLITIFLL